MLPDPPSGMSKASLAVVAAGAGGVAVRFLNFQPGHLGVNTVQLRHAVLLQILITKIYVCQSRGPCP